MATRAGSIRNLLEREIVSGERMPGDRLDEPQLTRRFGVSRTPVREALVELATVGLVEMRPHRSAVVAEIGVAQILEMYEVLAELEGLSARLAARRMTDRERSKLRSLHEDIALAVESDDHAAFAPLNQAFHDLVHAGSHNGILIGQIDALNRRLSPYRRIYREEPHDLGTPHAEHGAVVEAILDRDEQAADPIFRSHTTLRAECIADFIAAFNRRFERKSA